MEEILFARRVHILPKLLLHFVNAFALSLPFASFPLFTDGEVQKNEARKLSTPHPKRKAPEEAFLRKISRGVILPLSISLFTLV
jgi:hypothetical protein